jgi:type I restriction enzyme M protein
MKSPDACPGQTLDRATKVPSLDVFWLKDKSLTDLDNLPEPDELAEDIIENLEAGLTNFRQVLAALNKVA